jgi:hypothetical protein
MKSMRHFLFLVFILFPFVYGFSQCNGIVVDSTNQVKIIKVWGTHAQRGYAYGYLQGEEIGLLVNSYLKPQFGGYYSYARNMVSSGNNLSFDSIYIEEAQEMVNGMNAAGTNVYAVDYIDILVANSFLDIAKLLGKSIGMGCSSLVSWGEATEGTNLNSGAIITRNLDWTVNSLLVHNQVVVIHQPSEENEQNFALIGFSGMMSVLSGFNNKVGVFQHMMDDFSGSSSTGMAFEPVWLSLRKSLEINDYNADGVNNVQDVKQVLADHPQGYADGYIISCVASFESGNDTLIGMMAEICPQSPQLTFRYNTYPDSIPGDNVYTANYQISRNNAMHFCNRYNAVKSAMGDGTNLGSEEHWALMRDHSHLPHNIQLMQFAPEFDRFRIAAHNGTTPAYLNDYVDYSVDELLNSTVAAQDLATGELQVGIFPNPAADFVSLTGLKPNQKVQVQIWDMGGGLMENFSYAQKPISLKSLKPGVYFLKVSESMNYKIFKLVKL